jgi:Fungal Zn(2)-Cys(6) binuclear cluster domain
MQETDDGRMNSPTKRKASVAGFPNGVRPAKRRAAKACQTCRSRKVRCDVVDSGAPCNNCRLDEIECVVADSKRKRKLRDTCRDGKLPVSPTQRPTTRESISSTTGSDGTPDQWSPAASAPGPFFNDSPSNSFELDMDNHVPHLLCQYNLSRAFRNMAYIREDRTQGHRLSQDERLRRISATSTQSRSGHQHQPTSGTLLPAPHFASRTVLPPYVRRLPPALVTDDIEYLQKKGCLDIPTDNIRNALLSSYIQYVHPYMPILDLEHFLCPVEASDGSMGKISLLLLQAVLFAGAAFVDGQYLFAAGFSDRKTARKTFCSRAKVCFLLP